MKLKRSVKPMDLETINKKNRPSTAGKRSMPGTDKKMKLKSKGLNELLKFPSVS